MTGKIQKRVIFLLFVFFFMTFSVYANSSCSMFLYELRCEYLDNPLALQVQKPRFSWKLRALNRSKYGQYQKAYRILVSSSKEAINKNRGDIWDSKWVLSDKTHLIEYEGEELCSNRTYYWKVQIKDENGIKSGWSEVKFWNTGYFKETDWTAQWIGSDQIYDNKADCNIWDPWFKKTVELVEKPTKALMFVASVGFHELYVNGQKVSEDVLSPLVNDHVHRASYVGYDIAPFLSVGKNTIALWLGTSWSIFITYNSPNRPNTPIVIAQADLFYRNSIIPEGCIKTDDTWVYKKSNSKLLGNWSTGNMGGELIDENQKDNLWNHSLVDSSWTNSILYFPKLILSSENAPGNRVLTQINPRKIEKQSDTSYRVDMGRNYAGWTEIEVKGEPFDTVQFFFSEREQEEITFKIRSALVLNSQGKGIFKNRFNYSSGRWITINGVIEKPKLSDITGWLVRTNYENATSFECSDPLQNQIYRTILWTFENLSLGGYIVDCPQRERLGYGGDAHATSETGLFNYKMGSFYTKWMQDWRDVQGWEPKYWDFVGGGTLPHTAPTRRGAGGPAWGGICISLPWFLYQHEGDVRILSENFEMMKMWLDFLDKSVKNGILQKYGKPSEFLSDWLWPNAVAEGLNNYKPQTVCFNSCFYVFNLRTAAKIANVLDKEDLAIMWKEKANEYSLAIHEKFYNLDDNSYSEPEMTMANLAIALLAEVPPLSLRSTIMNRLEREILEIKKGHIHVGITGGAILFNLLRKEGRSDLIYSMVSKVDYPSWGYMLNNGATTIWEAWEKDLPGHSLLHSSYLYPGAWYIDGLAGIRRGDGVGFKLFYISPPSLQDTSINWVKCTYDSPVGDIVSSWRKEGEALFLEVEVPANSLCHLFFPGNEINSLVGDIKVISEKKNELLVELRPGVYKLKGFLHK